MRVLRHHQLGTIALTDVLMFRSCSGFFIVLVPMKRFQTATKKNGIRNLGSIFS